MHICNKIFKDCKTVTRFTVNGKHCVQTRALHSVFIILYFFSTLVREVASWKTVLHNFQLSTVLCFFRTNGRMTKDEQAAIRNLPIDLDDDDDGGKAVGAPFVSKL